MSCFALGKSTCNAESRGRRCAPPGGGQKVAKSNPRLGSVRKSRSNRSAVAFERLNSALGQPPVAFDRLDWVLRQPRVASEPIGSPFSTPLEPKRSRRRQRSGLLSTIRVGGRGVLSKTARPLSSVANRSKPTWTSPQHFATDGPSNSVTPAFLRPSVSRTGFGPPRNDEVHSSNHTCHYRQLGG